MRWTYIFIVLNATQVRRGRDAARGEGSARGRGGDPHVLPGGCVHRARAGQQGVGDARHLEYAHQVVPHERAGGHDARVGAARAHAGAEKASCVAHGRRPRVNVKYNSLTMQKSMDVAVIT
jgi:hypothetical protein